MAFTTQAWWGLQLGQVRDPESTRQHLLEVSAEEIHHAGFQAASLSVILEKAGMSKGALYHHFPNKQELGYAVFEEVFAKDFLQKWDVPIGQNNLVQSLCDWFGEWPDAIDDELDLGCAVCNVAQEMSSIDEGFRVRTVKMFQALGNKIALALQRAQQQGEVNPALDAHSIAAFIVSVMQGIFVQVKYTRDINLLRSLVKCLQEYLWSLKLDP